MIDRHSPFVKWSPHLQSVMRAVTGILFLQHGSQKLFAVPAEGIRPTVDLFSLMGLAGTLEFFGGMLILVGLFTRPVAFILSGQMAIAYFMAHAPKGFWPILNKGELAVLYCFVFLYLAAAGGGAWSVDRFWRKRN